MIIETHQTPLPAKEFEQSVKKVREINWALEALGMTCEEIGVFWKECFADANELNKNSTKKSTHGN